MLKTHTREVLYERFRTEKLLVRRATQKIGEKEAKRLFEGTISFAPWVVNARSNGKPLQI